ncbi:MAG: 50S ribosomal protein L24 [Gammaproteobacteria bacterium]|nr:50S ribosomal protein L24 [Gammaproteobacteria bacterium]MDE2251101.1 50S ribosomal protein L24 [Gammaproteobacteria bacterium]
MRTIRKGDQVVVLSGRDKGRRGAVVRVLSGGAVLVEHLNRVKRHTKPNPQANQPGGIIEKEMPLPLSKVALWNPAAKKGDRVGIRTLADGKKVRFFKSNGEVIDA